MAKQIIDAMKPTHEQITQRAYEIYLKRGCPEGCDLEHWLEAERQLSAEAEPAAKETASASADSARSRSPRPAATVSTRKNGSRQTARA